MSLAHGILIKDGPRAVILFLFVLKIVGPYQQCF